MWKDCVFYLCFFSGWVGVCGCLLIVISFCRFFWWWYCCVWLCFLVWWWCFVDWLVFFYIFCFGCCVVVVGWLSVFFWNLWLVVCLIFVGLVFCGLGFCYRNLMFWLFYRWLLLLVDSLIVCVDIVVLGFVIDSWRRLWCFCRFYWICCLLFIVRYCLVWCFVVYLVWFCYRVIGWCYSWC